MLILRKFVRKMNYGVRKRTTGKMKNTSCPM